MNAHEMHMNAPIRHMKGTKNAHECIWNAHEMHMIAYEMHMKSTGKAQEKHTRGT
jgi:hypothetical protein